MNPSIMNNYKSPHIKNHVRRNSTKGLISSYHTFGAIHDSYLTTCDIFLISLRLILEFC